MGAKGVARVILLPEDRADKLSSVARGKSNICTEYIRTDLHCSSVLLDASSRSVIGHVCPS